MQLLLPSVLQEHVRLPSIDEHVDFAKESPKDHVQEYAQETVSLGLIFWNFKTQQEKVMESGLYIVGDIFC